MSAPLRARGGRALEAVPADTRVAITVTATIHVDPIAWGYDFGLSTLDEVTADLIESAEYGVRGYFEQGSWAGMVTDIADVSARKGARRQRR